MSTGTAIAIVAGVVGVGAIGFLVLRRPALPASAAAAKVPANASAGSLISTLGGSFLGKLGTSLGSELGGSISDWLA
jgi:hypothetical protein